jgi:spore coat protein A
MEPEPHERGWKDTVQCPPGMITRIITKFEGYAGKYLYHCHILEHESNDMMRPFEVVDEG